MPDTTGTDESVGLRVRDLLNEEQAEKSAIPGEDAKVSLADRMVRRPTDADFADVLTPEGDSGSTLGSDISDSIFSSNDSVGGTG